MLVFVISFHLLLFITQARFHFHHHKKHKHSHPISQISLPPAPAPGPSSNQSPNDEYPFNSSGIFDVRIFGAVGDGTTDDTVAFKTAWDAACQVESGVLLVPYGYSFMIQSTIFTGPCQGGLVFQVINLVILVPFVTFFLRLLWLKVLKSWFFFWWGLAIFCSSCKG